MPRRAKKRQRAIELRKGRQPKEDFAFHEGAEIAPKNQAVIEKEKRDTECDKSRESDEDVEFLEEIEIAPKNQAEIIEKEKRDIERDKSGESDEDIVFLQEVEIAPKKPIEIIEIETETEDDDDDEVVDITDEVKAEEERRRRRKAIFYTKTGKMDFKNENYELAKRQFKRSIDEGSLNYVNYLLKSRSEYALNNLQEACNDARSAINLAQRDGSVIAYQCHIWLLEIKLSMGEWECCKKLIENIRRRYKSFIDQDFGTSEFKRLLENVNKLTEYVALSKSLSSPEEIIKISVQAVKLAPKCATLFLAMAKAYIDTENYLEARSACVSALKYKEDCFMAKYYQLQSFYMSGCLKEAMGILQEVRRATEKPSEDFEEFKGITALHEEGENIKFHANSYNYNGIKDCLFNCQKIINSSSALKNYKLEAVICLKLAVVYNETRDYKEALDWCKKATELDKNNVQAFLVKGDIEMTEELYADAYNSYESALTLDRLNPELRMKLALVSQLNTLPNHYEILGLKMSATEEKIAKTYRSYTRKYHPDKNFGAPKDKIVEYRDLHLKVQKAYTDLTNPEERRKHDGKRQELINRFRSTLCVSNSDFIQSICF